MTDSTDISDISIDSPSTRTRRFAFLGLAPLIEGEDPAHYEELLAQIANAVQPSDMMEEIWLRDIVDLTWDISRYRRLKTALLNVTINEEIAQSIAPAVAAFASTGSASENEPENYDDQDNAVDVEKVSGGFGVDQNLIVVRSCIANLGTIERLERLTMEAEGRRNAALREIERHRAAFAGKLRRAAHDIHDAEFEEVVSPKIETASGS